LISSNWNNSEGNDDAEKERSKRVGTLAKSEGLAVVLSLMLAD
jgi:hypothetical protein